MTWATPELDLVDNELLYYELKLTKYQLFNEQYIDLLMLSLPNSAETYEEMIGKPSRFHALKDVEDGQRLWEAAKLLSTRLRLGEQHGTTRTRSALPCTNLTHPDQPPLAIASQACYAKAPKRRAHRVMDGQLWTASMSCGRQSRSSMGRTGSHRAEAKIPRTRWVTPAC